MTMADREKLRAPVEFVARLQEIKAGGIFLVFWLDEPQEKLVSGHDYRLIVKEP